MTTSRFAFIVLALAAVVAVPADPVEAHMRAPDTERVVIHIDGMSCSACANGVAASLRRVEGVLEATVTMDPPEARITFDPSLTTAESLVEVILDLGYEAELLDQ